MVVLAAMYVRQLVATEVSGATAAMRTVFLRMSDALLLTTASLRAAHIQIGDSDEPRRTPRGSSSSARSRFTVVAGRGGDR